MSTTEYAIRKTAVHLLRSGRSPAEVTQELNCSLAWVYKWRKRFFAERDWQALHDQPRAPKRCPKKLPEAVRQAIRQERSELEAEAAEPGKLSYIDAHAISARLRKKKVSPLPGITSIERELRAAEMTRPRKPMETVEVVYPHLHPTQPMHLIQVDIVPHYLRGGPCVSCFNAIDVVSRYPTGQQSLTKRSEDAANFLLYVWKEIGIPEFTQVDNESCFSGGFTHPGVLGKVLRLALLVGTQLVFSPIRHPESNGTVERFHQDYSKNVWNKIELPDLQAVQQHSSAFFAAYRHSEHHSALNGRCPADLHPAQGAYKLPAGFCLPDRLPLTVGQVHFIRRVSQEGKAMILNMDWDVPLAQPDRGVWATIEFTLHGATLRFYNAAPDVRERTCLAERPFPLKEEVQPLVDEFQRPIEVEMPSLFRSAVDLPIDSLFSPVSTML
ncbi:MAG: integrase core domain-containing protein [Candidatus Eisenbacteria bacterium]|nr:integrase core domain-containing protein [Candidatus Eisenbacteria bacterium]